MATKAAAKAEPDTLVLDFAMERETKNTIRFQEQDVPEGDRAAIGTLYITKEALTHMGNFKTIRVTVEATS